MISILYFSCRRRKKVKFDILYSIFCAEGEKKIEVNFKGVYGGMYIIFFAPKARKFLGSILRGYMGVYGRFGEKRGYMQEGVYARLKS